MPARLGVKNRDKIEQSILRRAELKSYLLKLNDKVTVKDLAKTFGYSYWTLSRDITILDLWSKIKSFPDGTHIKIPTDEIDKVKIRYTNGERIEDLAKEYAVTTENLRDIVFGRQLRSPEIINPNIFRRCRLNYREYQILLLIRERPGERPTKLFRTYQKEFHNPCNEMHTFDQSLHRLASLKLVRKEHPSRMKTVYYPRYDKYLCRDIDTSSGLADKDQSWLASSTNFSSYIGKNAVDSVELVADNDSMESKSKIVLYFNKTCNAITNNKIKCGGRITRGRDGVEYCEICGLVDNDHFFPELNNQTPPWRNPRFSLGCQERPKFVSKRIAAMQEPQKAQEAADASR